MQSVGQISQLIKSVGCLCGGRYHFWKVAQCQYLVLSPPFGEYINSVASQRRLAPSRSIDLNNELQAQSSA